MSGLRILSLLLPLNLLVSGVSANQERYRVTTSPGITRLFQVSNVNDFHQMVYAYNASTAREVCESMGVSMATKDHVQNALDKGFETCRFGWIDENFAVVPRIVASPTCAKNMTGLSTWRASVTHKFDVFCFNSSDMEGRWEVSPPDSPLTARRPEENSHPSTGTQVPFSLNSRPTSDNLDLSRRLALATSGPSSSPLTTRVSPFLPLSLEDSDETSQSMSGPRNAIGAPVALLITFICALFLSSFVLLLYFKRNVIRTLSLSWKAKEKHEYVETEDWTCVKKIKEIHKEPTEDPEKGTANVCVVDIIEKDTEP